VSFGTKLVWFFWGPLSMVPLMLLFAEMHIPQPFSYHWHKALHVIGALIFVGNVVTQGLWIAGANATKSAGAIRAAIRSLGLTDLYFMGPGMFLVIANGAILAQAWGGLYRWSWLVTALVLFGVWGTIAIPLTFVQVKQYRLARDASDEELVAAMGRPARGMLPIMVVMLAVPVVIAALMVLKPRLW
jgi:uncharacterized membrane protein